MLVDATLKATPADKDKKPYIVATQPDKSWLFERTINGEMPPKEIRQRPTPAEIETVRQWITGGARAYPITASRSFVSIEQTLTAVRDDLRASDREDQPFLRYFSLAALHNNPTVPDRDIRIARAALSKAVNSLSWKPRIVLPRAVDEFQTVYAIDIRQLDWDRKDLWRQLIAAYPFGVRYNEDEKLRLIDEENVKLSRSVLPIIRADWFVAVATRGQLYHTMLQLPKTAGELEQTLRVNVRENYLRDQLWRAAFFPSGVSVGNRMLERHEALYGAYWKSYDFKPKTERGDLKKFPLGPNFTNHPFEDQVFVHDGGEIIFHLPNGLQGYMLINGQDGVITDGPADLVSDPLKTSGTNVITNGVSCMSCHKHGMIPFTDQIRDGAAVFGEAARKVKRLYPPAADMRQLVLDDQQKFMTALDRAVSPFLRVAEDKDKPLVELSEPIGELVRFYALAALDLPTVASELGIEKSDVLVQRVGENRLRELGLGVLFNGGRLPRQEWTAAGECRSCNA